VWWHRGRCLSYGDGVAFWALAEIVRQRLDIAVEDAIEIATDKLRVGVAKYIEDPAERSYIGIRLGRLLGLRFDGDTGQELPREELFAGWRLWFERLAASQPVVLLVEDLHYADEGLLDFLDYLLDWARDVAIFVLASTRPEMRVSRTNWGTGRNRTRLELEPLDGESVARLLDSLVPGMPADAAAAIAAQARGIPLFAVETIRALIDQDIVVPREGVYRLTGGIGTLTVPDSLHSLLAARLDALDPSTRALVADAAVLGSSFPVEALAAISARAEDEVRTTVADLVRREVFEISADRLSPQRGNYRFSHDMLRQVAYDTLSRHDRRARHLAVASHLRSAFTADGDEVSDVIARHYLDALSAVPDDPDADTVRGQAIEALIRAGERTARTGSLARGGELFAQAAELTAPTESPGAEHPAAQLWERAASTALDGARWEVIVEYAERAAELYAAAEQRRAVARVQLTAARALKLWGLFAEARERIVPALQVLSEEPDADTVVALSTLGSIEAFDGGPDADRLSNEAVVLSQVLDVPMIVQAGTLTNRGIFLAVNGRWTEAVAYHREAARLAEQAGDVREQARALINLGDTVGRFDAQASLAASLSAMELTRRTGDLSRLPVALNNAVVAQAELGLWDDAERTAEAAVEVDGLDDDTTLIAVAWIAAIRGNADRAASLVAGMTDLQAAEDSQSKAGLSQVYATIAAAQGSTADALRHARTALEQLDVLSPSTDTIRWVWCLATRAAHELGDYAAERELLAMLDGYRPGQLGHLVGAERALCIARLAATSNDDADALFRDAVAELRAKSTPFHLAHGLLDYAEYLGAQSETGTALVDEAREIGARLGAASVLDRIAAPIATPAPVDA
jgi:tetratricopeptide (TPR) repeat protein